MLLYFGLSFGDPSQPFPPRQYSLPFCTRRRAPRRNKDFVLNRFFLRVVRYERLPAQMPPPMEPSENFDFECMCGLVDQEESVRRKAMADLACTYRGLLFSFVRWKFSSFTNEDAQDIVQDTLVALWQKVQNAEFDGEGSLKGLLFTMAYRKCVDELRRRTSSKRTDD